MLTAHSSRFPHPEPLSHIELDTSKSPLALLAQTCSQIGKSGPFPSIDSSNNSIDSGCLRISNNSMEKKGSESSPDGPCVLRTRSATCRPLAVCSPKIQDEDGRSDKSSQETFEKIRRDISELYVKTKCDAERNSSTSALFSASPSVGLSVPQFSALPLPPFPSSFPQPTSSNKPGTSVISTVSCVDPYCLGYPCTASLKPTFPLLYPSHSLPFSSTSAFTIFPPGLMRPYNLQSSVFNRVPVNSFESTLSFSASSPTPTFRNTHHTLGSGARFHPYFKSSFPTTSDSYYSLHGLTLYGQRLHLAP